MMRIIVATAALAVVAQAGPTPMEKVITLLKDLKTKSEGEGKKEATTYGKFACFCKDNTKKKSEAITDGQDKVDVTNADIGSKTEERKGKITQKGKEQQKIEETTVKLQDATDAYNKDKATYEATNADLTKAVNSAKRAHKALSEKKGAAFLDVGRSDVRESLDLAEALGMLPKEHKDAATAFLQVDPNDPAYKFHSGQILKIIKDLQTDFQKEKDTVNEEWEKTDKAFKSEKKEMEGKITTAKDEVKKLTGEISTLKGQIAKLNETLAETEATLKDDSAYLSDLTARCEEKGKAWDQRTKMRSDEVAALTKALEILEKNKDLEGKRAALVAAKPAVVAPAPKAVVKAVEKPVVKAVETPVAKKAVPSFLQVSRTQRTQEAVASVLRQEGARLQSNMLSTVASQIMADPFVKIKGLIQGLIERLLEEAKNEATKKGFCDTELGKSELTRKNRLADVNQLDSDLSNLEAEELRLTEEIASLKDSIKDLKAALKEATENRADEKKDNEAAIADAKAGFKAVSEALVILQDFYKSAAKASFVQLSASPIDEGGVQDGGFSSNYQGGQDSSKAILGLLEVLKSDFDRTDRKTTQAEADAHAEFIQFDRTSQSDISAQSTKQKLDEQDLATTKSAIKEGYKDMQTAQDLLDGALKNIEELKPTCIDTGMSYAERVQKREDEMKALEKALCMLDPNDEKQKAGTC